VSLCLILFSKGINMRIYQDMAHAANQGWRALHQSYEKNEDGFYPLRACREMGAIRRIAQTFFVKFLTLTTCGRALKNEKIMHWQFEVKLKKVTRSIFLVEIR
jgi:hypothetical protein